MWFLIEYDRPSATLVTFEKFEENKRTVAQEKRLSLEIELNRQVVAREVVILHAKDEAALRKTHRRYFESLDELIASFISALNNELLGKKSA